MKTLKQLLIGDLEYSDSWLIVAKRDENDEITDDSPARFESREFAKNGLPEGEEVILSNMAYMDWFTGMMDDKLFHEASDEEKELAANWYINEVFYSGDTERGKNDIY